MAHSDYYIKGFKVPSVTEVTGLLDKGPQFNEWLMREAGAIHFLCSPRRVGPLAQMACRHLVQVPPLQQNITERIWASLPWG